MQADHTAWCPGQWALSLTFMSTGAHEIYKSTEATEDAITIQELIINHIITVSFLDLVWLYVYFMP